MLVRLIFKHKTISKTNLEAKILMLNKTLHISIHWRPIKNIFSLTNPFKVKDSANFLNATLLF